MEKKVWIWVNVDGDYGIGFEGKNEAAKVGQLAAVELVHVSQLWYRVRCFHNGHWKIMTPAAAWFAGAEQIKRFGTTIS